MMRCPVHCHSSHIQCSGPDLVPGKRDSPGESGTQAHLPPDPVHPQDYHLLGIMWKHEVYADQALPFGLRSAPKIFSALSDMIAWAFHLVGLTHQIHYLDDFLFMEPPVSHRSASTLETALKSWTT